MKVGIEYNEDSEEFLVVWRWNDNTVANEVPFKTLELAQDFLQKKKDMQ